MRYARRPDWTLLAYGVTSARTFGRGNDPYGVAGALEQAAVAHEHSSAGEPGGQFDACTERTGRPQRDAV